jgi:hypothetical protein
MMRGLIINAKFFYSFFCFFITLGLHKNSLKDCLNKMLIEWILKIIIILVNQNKEYILLFLFIVMKPIISYKIPHLIINQ